MKTRRTLPLSAWPALDRRLWDAAQGHGYAATLTPGTLQRIVKGYGRWLAVLFTEEGVIDVESPADRVTQHTIGIYVERLIAVGNAPRTVGARLEDLVAALRIIAPQRNMLWLYSSQVRRNKPPRILRSANAEHQFRDWPPLDRTLWEAAFQPADLLTVSRPAAQLRPATIASFISYYRHWLLFLRDNGRLDPLARPAARVTREAVAAYLAALRLTHANSTIVMRFSGLRSVLAIMEPDLDFRWLTAPGGRSLASWLPITKKTIAVPDSKFLYEQGLAMMQNALLEPHPDRRRLSYRNGLLVALFAARAPRVRSMASLRLGKTVIKHGLTYRLVFEHDNVKTGRHIEFDAPAGLSNAIDHYIEVIRAELLSANAHNFFWVSEKGDALSIQQISNVVRRISKKLFGGGFGPHRFRHALGTTAPLIDPAHPGVAAAVLGISSHMVERHYNRASQADVAQRFHGSLKKQRDGIKALAHREFSRQTKKRNEIGRLGGRNGNS